jgi:hypothetical protein
MNGTEQRQRHTAVDAVTRDVEAMSLLVEELDQRGVTLAGIVERIDHRLVEIGKGAYLASDALEKRIAALERSVAQLQERSVLRAGTFWQRLRWLLRGR